MTKILLDNMKTLFFYWLEPLIEAAIREKLLAFYRVLREDGQIPDATGTCPKVD